MGDEPSFIAELSGNHSGAIDLAFSHIDAAAKSGAKYVKIQTYKPDTITINSSAPAFTISDPDSLWHGRTLWDVYQEAHTPWEWHKDLFDYAHARSVTLFSSPFDPTAVDLLEECNCPIYKVASFEITDLQLLKVIGSTSKPVIMSTGMATLSEIDTAISTLSSAGATDITLLKCTSSYPAPVEDANLLTIPHLANTFNLPCGLSDHCLSPEVTFCAVALGAPVIEKHFKLSADHQSIDSAFSLDPSEFESLIKSARLIWSSLGTVRYGGTTSDLKFRSDRRSLYFTQDLPKGTLITESHIRSVRPGHGLPTSFLNVLIGKHISVDVTTGQPVQLDCFFQ